MDANWVRPTLIYFGLMNTNHVPKINSVSLAPSQLTAGAAVFLRAQTSKVQSLRSPRTKQPGVDMLGGNGKETTEKENA